MKMVNPFEGNPNYKPSPPNRTYSGPMVPTAYDPNWQIYNNLTADQIAWFRAQPEWHNFVAWVALDPAKATIHADAPDAATINAALQTAGQTISVTPLPSPLQPVVTKPNG